MRIKMALVLLSLLLLFIPQVKADYSVVELSEARSIETNFYWAKLSKYDFLPGKSLLVQANLNQFYIGNRSDRLVYKVQLIDNKLEIKQQIELPNPPLPNHQDNYLLDLYLGENHLYAAVGEGSRSSEICGGISIYDFKIKMNGDLEPNPKILFKSKPCVWGDTGGHVWTARLAGDKRNIYIAGGNWLVDWQFGTFPWKGFLNLTELKGVPSTNFYGSITRINLESKKWKVIATGLRNLGGLFYDPSRKILFNTDNGTRGGDKLNIVVKNANFGWPKYSLGLPYTPDSSKGARVNTLGNSTAPLLAWLPSISPSTISTATDTGDFSKYWANDLYIGTLKDKSIHRVRISDENTFIYDEPIKIGYRIRSHTTLFDGRILMATDTGEILILSEESQIVQSNFPK